MILVFELSMPNVGSWNGKWTGSENYYAITRTFRGKENEAIAKEILETEYYHYNFGDGWSACISVRDVDSKEAAKCKKRSRGFYGYEWMVESIVNNGKIICPE